MGQLRRPTSAGLLGDRAESSHEKAQEEGKVQCQGSEVGLWAPLKPHVQETVSRTVSQWILEESAAGIHAWEIIDPSDHRGDFIASAD